MYKYVIFSHSNAILPYLTSFLLSLVFSLKYMRSFKVAHNKREKQENLKVPLWSYVLRYYFDKICAYKLWSHRQRYISYSEYQFPQALILILWNATFQHGIVALPWYMSLEWWHALYRGPKVQKLPGKSSIRILALNVVGIEQQFSTIIGLSLTIKMIIFQLILFFFMMKYEHMMK